jgi:hypothetical protein
LRGWEKMIKPPKMVSNPVKPKVSTQTLNLQTGKPFLGPFSRFQGGRVRSEREHRLRMIATSWSW